MNALTLTAAAHNPLTLTFDRLTVRARAELDALTAPLEAPEALEPEYLTLDELCAALKAEDAAQAAELDRAARRAQRHAMRVRLEAAEALEAEAALLTDRLSGAEALISELLEALELERVKADRLRTERAELTQRLECAEAYAEHAELLLYGEWARYSCLDLEAELERMTEALSASRLERAEAAEARVAELEAELERMTARHGRAVARGEKWHARALSAETELYAR